MPKKIENKTFSLEKAFQEIEDKMKDMESEDVSLEDSFKIYQEGMKLLKECNSFIDDIEKKVLILEENGEEHEF